MQYCEPGPERVPGFQKFQKEQFNSLCIVSEKGFLSVVHIGKTMLSIKYYSWSRLHIIPVLWADITPILVPSFSWCNQNHPVSKTIWLDLPESWPCEKKNGVAYSVWCKNSCMLRFWS